MSTTSIDPLPHDGQDSRPEMNIVEKQNQHDFNEEKKTETPEEEEDEESSCKNPTFDTVIKTWGVVQKIEDYKTVAGTMLFQNIFEIAPAAKALFAFTQKYEDGDETLYKDVRFLAHARGVIRTVDAAVSMLGPDLGPLVEVLKDLGGRHVAYGVVPEHYPIVGESLLKTLEAALGEEWTPQVEEAWTAIYEVISTTMIAGATEKAETD